MKTEAYFEEYNQFITNQSKAINELEQQRNDLQAKIKSDKEEYKQLVANGEDAKADELYQTTDADERQLKAISKRLATKQEVFDETRKEKAIELIKHQADLPHLYKNDKERILAKFEPIVEEYNKILNEISKLNDEYEIEFDRFVRVYDKENFEMDKEVRAEIKNYFSPNRYSNYVGGDELPFINIRNKMQLRGDK
ncbi:pathogenicity island protein [Staphylococcus epidermidis]|uniref:pathogenicity island protein n=1 Tax=Staphylococcus epidermidis TaxID=1282 RepID=UPI002095DFA3|nr:pathogenicity island protein [Staphylococcus epidermidis]MCO6212049.1 pathogenicity island protein [Staphylococcus epidermidis]